MSYFPMMYQALLFRRLLPLVALPLLSATQDHSLVDSAADAHLRAMFGQCIMVAAYSNGDAAHMEQLADWTRNGLVGGMIWMQGGPGRQRQAINRLQNIAEQPLLMAQDAEWGAAMRLDSLNRLPWPLTLGATHDSALAWRYGQALAAESKSLGIHVSFSPVVDLNTNPNNPIIGQRAIGSNTKLVNAMSSAMIAGFHSEAVMACAKHFPGHGDSDSDSHKGLPRIAHDLNRLKALELNPFAHAVKAGVDAVMVAHLAVPALDSTGTAASISKPIVSYWLRDSLGFEGLIFTDAMNMKGLTQDLSPGELEVQAFIAGNDILLFVADPQAAIDALVEAVHEGRISFSEVTERFQRVMAHKPPKQDASHAVMPPMDRKLMDDLSLAIAQGALTLMHDDGGIMEQAAYHVITMGDRAVASLADPGEPADGQAVALLHMADSKNPWKQAKLSADLLTASEAFQAAGHPVVLVQMGNPYGLRSLDLHRFDAVVLAYENTTFTQQAVLDMLELSPDQRTFPGRVPVNLGIHSTWSKASLSQMGLAENTLDRVNGIVMEGLNAGAYPGCQVFLARHGKQVINQAWGSLDGKLPTQVDDLYDVASLTKILATVPLLMQDHQTRGDGGLLTLTMEDLLPHLLGTAVGELRVKDVLAHQSGLPAWIPFFQDGLDSNGEWKASYLQSERSDSHPIQVAQHVYAGRYWPDSIQTQIASLTMLSQTYRYSDLGYFLFQRYLESKHGMGLEAIIASEWFEPMGLAMTYLPLDHGVDLMTIAPTEHDVLFRKQVIRGTVHDPGAAIMGGVGGHAGLFAKASDVGRMMQLYLDGGSYMGQSYVDAATVKAFTACVACEDGNRRGLGFDRPQEDGPGPTCGCVSPLSFGHTGFTGTFAWADPETGTVLVFLSNRVYPDADNWKISHMDIRTRIQEVVQQSVLN